MNHVGIVAALALDRFNVAPVLDDVLRFVHHPGAYCTAVTSMRDGSFGVCQTRCCCALKSDALARKMFGTQVCGFRS